MSGVINVQRNCNPPQATIRKFSFRYVNNSKYSIVAIKQKEVAIVNFEPSWIPIYKFFQTTPFVHFDVGNAYL